MSKQVFILAIKNIIIFATLFFASINCKASLIFINEIHYDNVGGDQDEFVELAGSAGLNLSNWSLQFYNGSNGLIYKSVTIGDITLADQDNGFGFLTMQVTGIQNGSSGGVGDGIAIVDDNNQLMQFLSYEGAFEAQNGAALGVLSNNIAISQNGSAKGKTLQLTGSGSNYQDFQWVVGDVSKTAANVGQHFTGNTSLPVVQVSEPNLQIVFISLVLIVCSRARKRLANAF